MQTFDARPDNRVFWSIVIVPPVVFWILVEGVANGLYGGQIDLGAFVALMALAFLLPAGALLWTICSVAAYSIRPGCIVIHRVVGDRTVPLAALRGLIPGRDGSVRLVFPHRALVVRSEQPGACLAALQQAAPPPVG